MVCASYGKAHTYKNKQGTNTRALGSFILKHDPADKQKDKDTENLEVNESNWERDADLFRQLHDVERADAQLLQALGLTHTPDQ